jgi:hypothetical protein
MHHQLNSFYTAQGKLIETFVSPSEKVNNTSTLAGSSTLINMYGILNNTPDQDALLREPDGRPKLQGFSYLPNENGFDISITTLNPKDYVVTPTAKKYIEIRHI